MQAIMGTVRKSVTFFLLSVSFLLFVPTVNAANIEGRIFNFQQKMAKIGNAKAQFKLAYMYETGRGVRRDVAAARKWYAKAAEQNFTAADHRLIFLDVKKSGFRSKHKSWLKTVIRDANNGDDNVMFLLANMYEKGIAVKNDLKKARHYYHRSTAKGNADAESRLFALDQRIRKIQAATEKQKQLEQGRKKAEAKKQAEKLAKKRKEKQASLKKQQKKTSKAEKEKQRLIAERKKIAAEKKKLAALKADLARKKAAVKAAEEKTVIAETKENESDEVFEADLCTGKAARFRTQCN